MIITKIWNYILGRTTFEIDSMAEHIELWYDYYRGTDCNEYQFVPLDGRLRTHKRYKLRSPKMLSSEMRKLLFAEMPQISTDENIYNFLKENNFLTRLSDFSEYGAALGGFAIKLRSPDGKRLVIDFILANCFVPVTSENGIITEANFLSKEIIDNKNYIIVEEHRKVFNGYSITVKKYEEIRDNIVKIKFTSEPIIIETDKPLFVYIKYPEANNIEILSPLGISMFANDIDTIKSLDIAFDCFTKEMILGKKRIIVPASILREVLDDNGKKVKYFDPTDEAFVSFNMKDNENLKITDNTVELRIEELKLAIQTLLDILAVKTGFTAGAFVFDGVSIKTATEVISENSKTFRTKQAYENNVGQGVLSLLESIRTIGNNYGIIVSNNEYGISWSDSILEDAKAKNDRWNTRYVSGTCTLEEYLMAVDGSTEEEARARAEKIKSEHAVDIQL